jgi:hypothetical protein
METKIQEQPGIKGVWQINHGAVEKPELTFDPKAVHENLKQDLKRKTVKIKQSKLP